MDLRDQSQNFLKGLTEQGKSFNTIKNYRTDLKCFLDYWLDKKKSCELNEFTFKEIQEYSQFLDTKYGSENSKRRRVQALRLFFDYLVAKNLFPDNPVRKVSVFPKILDKPNPVSFPLIKKITQDFEERKEKSLLAHRNLILFGLIYGAGLKVSDIARLKRQHILDGDLLRVMVAPSKRDPYSIPLTPYWSEVMKDYLKALDKAKTKSGLEFNNLLFNANAYQILSGGLSPRGIELIFKELSGRYHQKMTARALRQSCIFKWILKQTPNTTIKEWMGVKPNYSLKPFSDLIKEDPSLYAFTEL